jgi:hypothetical protein
MFSRNKVCFLGAILMVAFLATHAYGVTSGQTYWITGTVKSISVSKAVITLESGNATATLVLAALDPAVSSAMLITLRSAKDSGKKVRCQIADQCASGCMTTPITIQIVD